MLSSQDLRKLSSIESYKIAGISNVDPYTYMLASAKPLKFVKWKTR